jgi:hypothetical protein
MMSIAPNLRAIRSLPRPVAGFFPLKKATVVICSTVQLPAKVVFRAINDMESCSRWPELRHAYAESCSPQINLSAEELREFTSQRVGKKCGSCGAVLTADDCTAVGWRLSAQRQATG